MRKRTGECEAMALSSRILALFCFTVAIPLVYSIDSGKYRPLRNQLVHCADSLSKKKTDLYFSSYNQHVSEDVGSVFINISSRGSVERKAYLYFDPYGE